MLKRNMTTRKNSKNKPCVVIPFMNAENSDPTVPEPTLVHNPTEPLLEVFKEEPQLEVSTEESLLDIPTDTHQPYNEIMLKPKLEPTHPIPEASLFCSLCLRLCTSGQVVDFSADVASGWDKLALILGLELELEQCEICRPCWTVVQMLADFREGCLKAATWRARFSFGLDEPGDDDWLSKENVEAMERTRKVVQEHVERIEMAEVEARNRHGLCTDESMEGTPMLEDSKNCEEDSSSNEIPQETPDSAEKSIIPTYSCAKCQRMFETKAGMKIHFDLCKKSSKDKSIDPQLHKCSICSANFTKSYQLREHRNKHLGIKPYACRKTNCNKRFHGNRDKFNHERRCKGNNALDPNSEQESPETSPIPITAEETPPKIYSCKKCPRKFDTEAGLVNHSKKCKGSAKSPKLHRCSICSIEFLHFHHLDAHMNRHNDIKPYQCKKNCDKRFYGKFELYRHTEICGQEKPICPLCGLQVSTKGGLSTHMKTHAEVPTAECETCGKKFKTKKTLKKHQQSVHTNERNYPCGVCGKTLKSADSLNVHQRIHTQEKPFGCTVCGQAFAYKSLLQLHEKKFHAEEKI